MLRFDGYNYAIILCPFLFLLCFCLFKWSVMGVALLCMLVSLMVGVFIFCLILFIFLCFL